MAKELHSLDLRVTWHASSPSDCPRANGVPDLMLESGLTSGSRWPRHGTPSRADHGPARGPRVSTRRPNEPLLHVRRRGRPWPHVLGRPLGHPVKTVVLGRERGGLGSLLALRKHLTLWARHYTCKG